MIHKNLIMIYKYHCSHPPQKYAGNLDNLLYKSQYGFSKLHSTEIAPVEINDIIAKHLILKKLPVGIFLHLSNAFGSLDHGILRNYMPFWWNKFQHYTCYHMDPTRHHSRSVIIYHLPELYAQGK